LLYLDGISKKKNYKGGTLSYKLGTKNFIRVEHFLINWSVVPQCRCRPGSAPPPRPATLDAGRRSGRASAPGHWPAALPARSSRRHRRSRSSRRLERACRGEEGGLKGTGPLGGGELLWPLEVGSIGLIVWPIGLVETGREATGNEFWAKIP
jgi:hypothetical protein